tara:strand:+ start:10882 stop:12213 length:1332 start_codon:yes stop_codon:yes gene_type:complete
MLKKAGSLFFLILYSCNPDFSEIDFSDSIYSYKKPKVIKILGGNDEDIVKKVVSTKDGGFVLIGNTKSTDGFFESKNRLGNDIFLIKMSSQGEILWNKTYGGSDDDVGNNVIEGLDGSFYIIGYSKSDDGDATINKGQHDNWLIKTDSFGNILWEKSYGFAGHDHSYNIILTSDGNLFFNGFIDVTLSNGEGSSSSRHGVGEFWCHKVTMNGEVIWRQYFGGTNNDRSYSSVETLDGGFIVVGTSESRDFDISNPNGSYDLWVIKLSKFGELIWEKSFGGIAIDEGVAIIKKADNTYTILGNTNSNEIEGMKNQGMNDYFLVNLDLEGNTISKIRHGSSQFDYAKDLIQTEDGSLLIVGYSRNPIKIKGMKYDKNAVFIIQTHPNGLFQNNWEIKGTDEDLGYSLSELNNGKIVIVGTTKSNDEDFFPSNYQNKNIFIAFLDN